MAAGPAAVAGPAGAHPGETAPALHYRGNMPRAPWLLAVAALCGGCLTNATIHRRTGPNLYASIDRSDPSTLYVTTPAADRYRVERSDIVDIDHPGKGAVWVGLGLATLGGLTWWLTGRAENPSGFIGIPRFFAVSFIVIGVPTAVGGAASYTMSREKAAP